jgi:protein-S-isoprenylcysteine O-methyltransferase Ste14
MQGRQTGYVYVVIQFLLLALLVFLPAFPSQHLGSGFGPVGYPLSALGLALVLLAGFNLGNSLSANPVPLDNATLKTTGLYGLVRHPIYLGLTLFALGITISKTSLLHLILSAMLFLWLQRKARFEERLLLAKFPGYAEYASKVGALIPGVGKRRAR